jgi:transposase
LSLPVDPNALPQDAETLKKMLVDVTAQLDRTERLLRQLLQAKTGRRSEQLSREQLALFATELGITLPETEDSADDHDQDPPAGAAPSDSSTSRGRKPLPRHLSTDSAHNAARRGAESGIGVGAWSRAGRCALKRERIEHDLPEQEKRCADCNQDLRKIGEEVSERYEYLPAQMKVIEDACFTYACACTVRTASKPPQPIEKSTAGASLLAQVIVSKLADHLPLHRQAKMFRRHGIEIAEQTMCGWMAQCAELLHPLYERLKRNVLASEVVGTDDTPVKVLYRRLPHARKGRIWPYVGDREHPAVIYDYTATRERAGPEAFLQSYRGYLLQIHKELLPKSEAGQAVNYLLKNWTALTRYCENPALSIDNNHTERSLRGWAVGRNNWTFFGSDRGGRTAAVLRSFVASCELVKVDPFAWFQDVLSRIASHPITRLDELLPDRWSLES